MINAEILLEFSIYLFLFTCGAAVISSIILAIRKRDEDLIRNFLITLAILTLTFSPVLFLDITISIICAIILGVITVYWVEKSQKYVEEVIQVQIPLETQRKHPAILGIKLAGILLMAAAVISTFTPIIFYPLFYSVSNYFTVSIILLFPLPVFLIAAYGVFQFKSWGKLVASVGGLFSLNIGLMGLLVFINYVSLIAVIGFFSCGTGVLFIIFKHQATQEVWQLPIFNTVSTVERSNYMIATLSLLVFLGFFMGIIYPLAFAFFTPLGAALITAFGTWKLETWGRKMALGFSIATIGVGAYLFIFILVAIPSFSIISPQVYIYVIFGIILIFSAVVLLYSLWKSKEYVRLDTPKPNEILVSPKKPVQVQTIAFLAIINGLFLFISTFSSMFISALASIYSIYFGLLTFIAILSNISILIGVMSFILAYGAWHGQKWVPNCVKITGIMSIVVGCLQVAGAILSFSSNLASTNISGIIYGSALVCMGIGLIYFLPPRELLSQISELKNLSQPQRKERVDGTHSCFNCGQLIEDEMKFCEYCGVEQSSPN